jgi:hypothetical protein
MKSDLSKVKVGDKIWTIESGWTKVVNTNDSSVYPVETENYTYTFDGKVNINYKYPSAFLECPFKAEPIEKDTLVCFRDSEDENWMVGYYSHFEKNTHCTFDGSKKSTETNDTTYWKIVTTENPLL